MMEIQETALGTELKIRESVLPKARKPNIKRVVAYARVSSSRDEAENSLSAQVNYYKEYIKDRVGWDCAGIYADDGISGTKVDRPEFQKMITACRNGEVDVVITKSITRFARNTMVLLETLRELKRLGVNVIFEKENIETASTAGELMLTILGTFAEEEAKSASLNQLWRIKRMFENGEITPTRMLGYYTEDGKLEIIPEEAEVVQKIFDYYLSGMGYCKITNKLREEGIETIKGNQYGYTVLRKILTNEKYAGDLMLQKTYVEDFRTKKKRNNHGEKTMYYVEDAHKPIIDKTVWEAVQKERTRRREEAPVNSLAGYMSGPYLFTKFIRCGDCGSYLYHTKRNNKIQWICNTYKMQGSKYCSTKAIPENILIAKTIEAILLISPSTDCSNLTRELMEEHISGITVPENNKLTFHFKTGIDVVLEWEHPSRSKSWTDEMKAEARRKALDRKEVING